MEPPGAESHYTSQNRLRVGQHQPPLDPWRRSLPKALPSAQNLPARGEHAVARVRRHAPCLIGDWQISLQP